MINFKISKQFNRKQRNGNQLKLTVTESGDKKPYRKKIQLLTNMGRRKILIFCSSSQLVMLIRAESWISEGSFEAVNKLSIDNKYFTKSKFVY